MTRLDKVMELIDLSHIETEDEKRNLIITNGCPDLWLDVSRCRDWRMNKDVRKCKVCWLKNYLGEEVKT